MSNDQLDDLKQFISASVSQSEERIRQEIQDVRQEMADGFLGVGEAIEEIHRQLGEQQERQSTTDQRLTKLEQKIA